MRKVLKIFSVIFVLLAGVVVTGVVILGSMDFNQYKGLITDEAKKFTGRDLTIDGDLKFEISLNPAIAVEGVTFANASWGSRPQMMKLKRMAAEVSLIPLLSGALVVDRLVLEGLDLLAETNAKGKGNWEFQAATPPGQPMGKATAAPAEGGGLGVLPVVRKVRIRNVKVTYRDGVKGETTKLALDSMDLGADSADSPLDFGVSGTLNGAPYKASGQLGAIGALLKGGGAYPVSIKAEAFKAVVSVSGSITDPLKKPAINVTVSAKGGELIDTVKAAGVLVPGLRKIALPPIGPYDVSALITGTPNMLSVANIKASYGGSDISGNLTANLGGARPGVNANFASNLLDLDKFLPPGGAKDAKQAPPSRDGRVFSSDPLPLSGLKAADAKINFKGGRVVIKGLNLNDVNVSLSLVNGNLKVSPFSLAVAGGKINGAVSLNSNSSWPPLAVKVNVKQVDYGALLEKFVQSNIAAGKVDINVDIKGAGKSVRAIMAGLGGKTRIVTKGGKIRSGLLNIVSANVLSALPFIDSKGDKSIKCGIIDFRMKAGKAVAKTFLIETGGMTIIGKGGVNLASEKLSLNFNPRAKKASLMKLAFPVNVSGTIANPSILPDVAGVTVDAVTGAVSTAKTLVSESAGAVTSIVSGRGLPQSTSLLEVDTTDYCKLAFAGRPLVPDKKASKAPAKNQKPGIVEKTTKNVSDVLNTTSENVGSALKGVGNAIGGIFGGGEK